MADRLQQVATPAPVAELIASWDARSAERFVAILEPDARVSVPPLHLELHGRDDVWLGVARLFAAFGSLQYTMRHRYLAPDVVTDEVLLEGVQTEEFLGAPPPGRPGSVAARVMMRHDGLVITELTVWPDVAALRELSDGVARRIDLRAGGPAAPVVAALRASIPAPAAKFSVGEGRPTATTAGDEAAAALLPGGASTAGGGIDTTGGATSGARVGGASGAGRETPARGVGAGQGHEKGRKKQEVPKAPLPRKVRRLRAFLAGSAMLVAAALLVTYVAVGVGNKKEPVALSTPKPTPTPTTGAHHARSSSGPGAGRNGSASPSVVPSAPASAKPSFDSKKNIYTFTNRVLFENNSAVLRQDAQAALLQVISALEGQKRYGTVVVTGYTDDTGTLAYNQRLSLRRARAVADFLRQRLTDSFSVTEQGRGEADPVRPNTSPANREQNRRVEIKVPRAQA